MERNREHVQFLDYTRGAAIFVIFAYHCLAPAFGRSHLPWGRWFSRFTETKSFLALLPVTFGWAGVAIFFVVSGFCIHLSYLKGSPGDWRGFFVRRFFRIYPPYLIALLLFTFVIPASHFSVHSRDDWAEFGSHLFLVHNLDPRSIYAINPSFWSIATEVQLYMIYPALLAIAGRFGWPRTLVILGTLEGSMRALTSAGGMVTALKMPGWFSESPFMFWYSWGIGAALADAFVQKRPLPFASSSAILWLLLGVCADWTKPLAVFSFPLFALCTATIIAKQLERGEGTFQLRVPSLSHLRFLGICSYSFYLLHQPLIEAWGGFLKQRGLVPGHPLLAYLLCLCTYPFLAALSWLYFKHLEVHSIAAGKLLLRRKA